MLKQETYQKVSEVFGTVVGVASVYGMIDLNEVEGADEPVSYKAAVDEIDINDIINKAIEVGRYKELQVNLYNIKRNPRMKDLTRYKRAWETIKK
jgi:hypothetical protein